MSPKPTLWQQVQKGLFTASALIGAVVVVVGAMVPVVKPVARKAIESTLDSTFVYQQSYQRDNLVDSLTHKQEVDSIFRDIRDIKGVVFRADSNSRCARKRKPGWCE